MDASASPVGISPNARAAVAKAAARSAGIKKYFTGKPCKNGHVTERWVSCGSCVGCQDATKAKLVDWMRDYGRDWREKNREKANAYSRGWNARNPGFSAAYMTKRRETERDAINARAREIYAQDPAKHLAKCKAWQRSHKVEIATHARTRRARKVKAEGSHTAAQIIALLGTQKHRCANCGTSLKAGYHADHIKPLVLGGSDWIRNIQLLCPTCNHRKGPKDPIKFAQQEGRLL